ncbi:SpoIIE family protein phosphatase [Yinghuangia sp. YIM S09857]|uniref:SpoIIE family protein phosphatase n=1 Tax=Yinghuangia sp. YIM S09857 TaxID=3436929 RepID=UPI003F52B2E3
MTTRPPASGHLDAGADDGEFARVAGEFAASSSAGLLILDRELRYLHVNEALTQINGVSAADHLGRQASDVMPLLAKDEPVLRAVLADGRTRELISSRGTHDADMDSRRYWLGVYDRWEADGEVRGIVGVVVEVSPAYRRSLNDDRDDQLRLGLFDAARERIGTTLDRETTCAELAAFAVPLLADWAAVDLLPEYVSFEGGQGRAGVPEPARGTPLLLRREAVAGVPGLRRVNEALNGAGTVLEHEPGSAGVRVLEQVRAVREDYRTMAARPGAAAARIAAYRAAGAHSGMSVPLVARGRTLGVLTLMRVGRSPGFTDRDEVTAREIATRAAVSLDHALHYEHEHAVALELQESLLGEPRDPRPDIDIATRYLPAGSELMVGGDWFDVVALPGGRTLKVMGDVMGHGLKAAVAMSHYRMLVRAVAAAGLAPHEMLQRLDDMVAAAGFDRVATCLLEVVDPGARTAQIASAGHLPPALVEPGGIRLLDVPVGPPLGTGAGGYTSTTVPRVPGPVMLLYTDGLVERRGEDIDASLRRLTELPPVPDGDDLGVLLDHVLDHLGPGAQDDIAVMASRLLPRG